MPEEPGGLLDVAGSPAEERRVLQSLLSHYDLALRWMEPRHGTIFTDRGPYQVRRFKGSWPELEFVAAALTHLESRGFTALRRLCRTTDNQPGVRLGTGLFYLVQGEPGSRFDAGRQKEEVRRAAEVLAAFHRAGEDLPPLGEGERIRYDQWPEVLQRRLADLQTMRREAVTSHGEFARLFAEYADDFLEQADRAVTGLLASPLEEVKRDCAARRRLAHRRFTPRRLRRLGQELLVDGWAHLALDLPVIDLARFVAAAAGNDPDRALTVLQAYDEALPIPEAEWEVFLAWLRFPHDFWRVGHLHFHRRESHRSRLSRVIRHEVEREVFIEALALQWVSRRLVPSVSSGLPEEAEGVDDHESSRKEEREATPVSDAEELVGIGWFEEPAGQDGGDDLRQELPVDLSAADLPVEEVTAERVDLGIAPAAESPFELANLEVSPWEETPVIDEITQVREESSDPSLAEEPAAESVDSGSPEEPLIELQAADSPGSKEQRPQIIVWKPFPLPLTSRR
ncbi:MAG: hypothetical protein ACM3XZ_06815 [Betaproteobacteria bacterium]